LVVDQILTAVRSNERNGIDGVMLGHGTCASSLRKTLDPVSKEMGFFVAERPGETG